LRRYIVTMILPNVLACFEKAMRFNDLVEGGGLG
jgi:hypothetical protein